MKKEEIIEQVIENTDWETIKKMRDIYMLSAYGDNVSPYIFTADYLRKTGKEILTSLLKEYPNIEGEAFVSTACLKAYKEDSDGVATYGIRFEADYENATVYIEENDSIFDDDLISAP